MADIHSKWITKDPNSLENDGNNLRVKVDPAGPIQRTSDGLSIKPSSITDGMLAGNISFSKLADNAVIARLDQDETVTGTWTFNSVPSATQDPVNPNDLTRKSYVDGAVQGLSVKDPVRALSDSNVSTMSGTATIDGVTLAVGDRVLLIGQTTKSENGIWVIQTGSWTRPDDFDTGDHAANAFCFVSEGSTYADTGWTCTADNPDDIIDTDDLDWVQFSSAGQIVAGAGLTKSGNTLNVGDANKGIQVNADDLEIDASEIAGAGLIQNSTNSHILEVGAGDGITVNANNVAVNPLDLIKDGPAEIDGDKIDIDYSPSAYTPSTTPPEVDNTAHLTAHLAGINNAIAAISQPRVERFTLSSTDITNKYVTLSNVPKQATRVILDIKGAGTQYYGDDYVMDGSNPNRLSWDGLGIDGVISAGDKITVSYDV